MAGEESLMDLHDEQESARHTKPLVEDLNGHQQTGDHVLPVQKNDTGHSALLADVQRIRVLFRRENFLVLARSRQNPRLGSDLADGGVEADLEGQQAIPSEPAVPRRATILDTLIYPERNRSTVFPGASTLTVPAWLETILVFIALAGSFAAHAINMFYYPHYEQDEGTYMMYAWAILHGSITNYPYGYGHPPLAWIQLALWEKLTGGFATFGTAINSGRVLVLFLGVGSAFLVYQIARKMGAGISACLLGLAIFSFSPISITFQREVLLDNFATFWFLLSFYLVVASKSRLFYTVSAAICFGISLLSKEVMIVYIPVMIYVAWLHTTRFQRAFALVAFIYIVIAFILTFLLMAALKGELFPYDWHLPWDHHPHLSLIDTFVAQTKRDQSQGSFIISWDAWVTGDPLLMVLSIAAPAFNLITGWWNRKRLFLSLLALSFWVLLARGGVDFAFYIIPLIPLIALNAVFALKTLADWIGRFVRLEFVGIVLILVALVGFINYDLQHSTEPNNLFAQRPALVETEVLTWIRTQVPRRAMIVINPNLYADLHEQEGDGVGDGSTYPHAEVYWNVALDPALHDTLLRGNWDRIDYIVADPGIIHDIDTYGGGMDMIKTALEHSILRVEFKGDSNELVQIFQVIHNQPPPEV